MLLTRSRRLAGIFLRPERSASEVGGLAFFFKTFSVLFLRRSCEVTLTKGDAAEAGMCYNLHDFQPVAVRNMRRTLILKH